MLEYLYVFYITVLVVFCLLESTLLKFISTKTLKIMFMKKTCTIVSSAINAKQYYCLSVKTGVCIDWVSVECVACAVSLNSPSNSMRQVLLTWPFQMGKLS